MGELYVTLSFDGYSIYANDKYYLCIPNEEGMEYQIYMGFSGRDLTISSKEGVINEIRKISDLINANKKDWIYVLPVIDPLVLKQAIDVNDDNVYNPILNNIIHPVMFDVNQRLTSKGKKVNAVINIVKQSDKEKKIIDWVDMKLMNNGMDYIQEIDVSSLKVDKIIDTPTPNVQGIVPSINNEISQTNSYTGPQVDKENTYTKKLVRKKDVSPGFSSMKFIIMILSVSLVLGISIGYMIIK